MKLAAVVFPAFLLFSTASIAGHLDQAQSVETRTTALGDNSYLPKVLVKINVPYGVSKLDLLGRGVAEDVAVRATYGGGAGPTDSIVLLTKGAPDDSGLLASSLHFITRFEESSYAIETNRRPDDGDALMTLSYLLRDANNPRKVYLTELDRMPHGDLQESNADITIKVYILGDAGAGPPDATEYSFQQIKTVTVKNFSGVAEAKLRQLEENVLHAKILEAK